jgi:alkylation response protein AidB-like acyl-CoA dehydrogenase
MSAATVRGDEVTRRHGAPVAVVEQVRADVRHWLADNWDPDLALTQWRSTLVDSGWARPSWEPRWYGRGLPDWADAVVAEEFASVGAAGTPVNGAMVLASAAIRHYGPDHMRQRFLRPLLTGEETWCQLFSEPDAGSDLAGLKTRAVLDDGRWLLNGQKLWSTSAHHADLAMVLVRTDPAAERHHGITFLVLPMRQHGIEVRPLRQMNGYSSFNEVFLTDAAVPVEYVVGEVGGGWAVAMTTLANERQLGTLKRPTPRPGDGLANRQAQQEAEEYFETYSWYPQRAGRVDLVIEHAQLAAVTSDAAARQEIARLMCLQSVSEWTAARAAAASAAGRPAGAAGSIQKLLLSQIARQAARVHSMLGGAHALLSGPDSRFGGVLAEVLISFPAQSIAGGTDEIQRNVLGERVLGLPRQSR